MGSDRMKSYKVAIVWRGDRETRAAATPHNNRYHRIFAELQALGAEAEPAVYAEELEGALHAQLENVDGVLVGVNPLEGGRTREKLDSLLREVAATGPWVSAHPDVGMKATTSGQRHILRRTSARPKSTCSTTKIRNGIRSPSSARAR